MTVIRAFAALRPPPAEVLRIVCPPREALGAEAARALAAANPACALHVTRPEVARLEPGEDADRRAAQHLAAMVSQGLLIEDREPHLYLYAQRRGHQQSVGVVACVRVEDYVSGAIKRHEQMRADHVANHARHIEELRAHPEPVLLTYRADSRIDELVADGMRAAPVYEFTTPDGVEHRAWVLDLGCSRALSARFAEHDARREAVPSLHLLGGHDVAAGAVRAHQALRGSRGGEDDVILAMLVPHDQVTVHACHRLVRDPAGRSPQALLEQLRAALDVEPVEDSAAATPRAPGSFGLYLNGSWYRARARKSTADLGDPVESIDAFVCHTQILNPIFGVEFSRYHEQVGFAAEAQGIFEAQRGVDGGLFSVAVILCPMRIEQILASGAAGRTLPPRSASCDPQPWSGLFMHRF
jgi:uncharacterized protein (DUF1015 family)